MKYFYINNKKYKLNNNVNFSIIDFCENIGETIPHFCYHKQLSVAGNCRMCLIELKNSPKPLISCAMSLVNKMEIYTNSPLVKKARENVLEFLLLNHPLDCPVCDQGSECDLQDQSFNFGLAKKRFYSFKRSVHNKNFGILIKTVMTRCIHCTRCVRFSKEISGTNELGVFGRGLNSEIGTYTLNNYNSEFSSNVIDICPVGALTSKPYSFVSRSWELKVVKSINFSDSFSQAILVYLKNNTLYKILPFFEETPFLHFSSHWITDKTRFSFTGMFSPERLSNTFLLFNKNVYLKSWKFLFKEFSLNIYFQDQLIKHRYSPWQLTVFLNETLSIELIFFLITINKQYSFFKLKKFTRFKNNNDLENSFLLNSNFKKTQLCCLIDVNPRYEGPLLNVVLRKLYLSGNFDVFYLGSLLNLTYPINYLGSNFKIIKSIIEGNHFFCQKVIVNPFSLFILGSNLMSGNSSKTFYELFNYLNYISPSTQVGFLNNTLEISVLNFIKKFKNISFNDIYNSNFLFFINTNLNFHFLKKIIELKILKFLNRNSFFFKTPILLQSNFLNKSLLTNYNKYFNSNLLFNFPNTNFFEESGSFINNLGILKKKVKIVNNLNSNSKSNWFIFKIILKSLNLVKFSSINLNNFKYLIYNFKSLKLNLNFIKISLLPINFYYTANCISNSSFNNFKLKKKNLKKKKFIYYSKTFTWVRDFFLGNTDLYSKFSTIMIKCSKNLRKINTNFLI